MGHQRLIAALKYVTANAAKDLYRKGANKIEWVPVSYKESGSGEKTKVFEGDTYTLTLTYEPGMASRISGHTPAKFGIELGPEGAKWSIDKFEKKISYRVNEFPSFKKLIKNKFGIELNWKDE